MELVEWTSPAGKRRVLARLDERERRRYDLAIRAAFPGLRTGPSVFGSPARIASLRIERRRWRAAVRARAFGARSVVGSDVADCYRSIGERPIRMAAADRRLCPRPLGR